MIYASRYKPDFDAFREASTRIVVAGGAESEGTFPYRAAMAVAKRLGTEAVSSQVTTAGSASKAIRTRSPRPFAASSATPADRPSAASNGEGSSVGSPAAHRPPSSARCRAACGGGESRRGAKSRIPDNCFLDLGGIRRHDPYGDKGALRFGRPAPEAHDRVRPNPIVGCAGSARQLCSLSQLGADDYGFTLDGDGRYLLEDFTVTHNTGKTIAFAALIARRGGGALVLAHRDELLRQAAEKIAIADPTLTLGVGFVAGQRDDVQAPVVVGSVQTLARPNRLARLPQRFDSVVVDEAHHASATSYRRTLGHLSPTPLILGVTATPARAAGKQLGDVWQEIVYQRGIAEMIRAGYLTDIRGVRVGLEQVNLDQVEQSGGDFDADALGQALEQASRAPWFGSIGALVAIFLLQL